MKLNEFKEIVGRFTEEQKKDDLVNPSFKKLLENFNNEIQKWNK